MSVQTLNKKTEPEWVREKELTARFGISHTIAYNLRRAGEIKSVSLRCEGKQYGARLYSVASVREFLARQEARELETGRASV